MPPSSKHQHRAGSLRQANKKHKSSASSKRSLCRQSGAGKIELRKNHHDALLKKNGGGGSNASKADRVHHAHQKREISKEQSVLKARSRTATGRLQVNGREVSVDCNYDAPRVIGIISLSGNVDGTIEERLRESIIQESTSFYSNQCHHGCSRSNIGSATTTKKGKEMNVDVQSSTTTASVTCRFDNYKVSLTILTNLTAFYSQNSLSLNNNDNNKNNNENNENNENDTKDDAAIASALDLCRICDAIIFLLDGNSVIPSQTNESDNGSIGTGVDNFSNIISERGERILTATKAQGLPTCFTVVAFCKDKNESMNNKKTMKGINKCKKYCQRLATTEFGDHAKLLTVHLPVGVKSGGGEGEGRSDCDVMMDDSSANCSKFALERSRQSSTLVRTLCTSSILPCKWSDMRPHLISDGCSHLASPSVENLGGACGGGYSYDPFTKELRLTGYLRGTAPINVNNLIHLPNLGTYHLKSIEAATPPVKVASTMLFGKPKNVDNDAKGTAMEVESQHCHDEKIPLVLAMADQAKRESLDPFASPSSLDGEQNLIGFEENQEEEDKSAIEAPGNSQQQVRPSGWSDYRAAWLDGVDDNSVDVEEMDRGDLSRELNCKGGSCSTMEGGMECDEDYHIVSTEEKKNLIEQRKKEHKEDLDFPDEVEIRPNEKASERFARYRSLKSFRKSFWDPKENLPDIYSSIYHMSTFKATQRNIFAEQKELSELALKANAESHWLAGCASAETLMSNNEVSSRADDRLGGCVANGFYVTLIVENVPSALYLTKVSPGSLLCAVSLLPFENKLSVLQMGITQSTFCEPGDAPVKSKDTLTFRCGWRSWTSRPVFSQNNLNSDKHKFERYLIPGQFVAASALGPVTYSPCPVLVFREASGDKSTRQLVAVGGILGADAHRIMVKRVVLTGYPTRVHKRHATVKYMFYMPDDIRWFKPAGLTTKHGLQGHIMESVGDHGTMKCLFNQPIKQHDTVCLPLYKRVYPKYAPIELPGDEGGTTMKKIFVA